MTAVRRSWRSLVVLAASAFLLAAPPAGAQATAAPDDSFGGIGAEVGRAPESPTVVGVQVDLLDLDVDEVSERYWLDGWLNAAWLDSRLESCDGDGDYRVYHGEAAAELLKVALWAPDFRIADGVGPREVVERTLTVWCDGFVEYDERFNATIFQPYDFRDFPFDEQEISFTVVAEPAELLEVVPLQTFYDEALGEVVSDPSAPEFESLDEAWESAEWRIRPANLDDAEVGAVTYAATIERKSLFYVLNIIAPLVLIVAMSWAVFWMDLRRMNLSERLGVSLTSLLTVVAFDFLTNDSLPRSGSSTRLDNLYVVSYLFVALTVVVSVIAEVRSTNGGEAAEAAAARQDRVCRVVFPVTYLLAAALVLTSPLGTPIV